MNVILMIIIYKLIKAIFNQFDTSIFTYHKLGSAS